MSPKKHVFAEKLEKNHLGRYALTLSEILIKTKKNIDISNTVNFCSSDTGPIKSFGSEWCQITWDSQS